MYRKFEIYKLTGNYGMHLVYVGAVGLVVCLMAPVIDFIWGGSAGLLIFEVGIIIIGGVTFLIYRRLYGPPPSLELLASNFSQTKEKQKE